MESALYQNPPTGLNVIETLRFDPDEGFVRLALHIDRCEATCAKLGFAFDRAEVLSTLGAAVEDTAARVKLMVEATGQTRVEVADLAADQRVWRVAIATEPLVSSDPWLQVKTSQRVRYDADRAALPAGVDEWLYLNERGEVCEGTITNVFARQGGLWITPPLSSGLLPGVLRQEMLQSGQAIEGKLTLADLRSASKLAVGNSLRGLIRAELV